MDNRDDEVDPPSDAVHRFRRPRARNAPGRLRQEVGNIATLLFYAAAFLLFVHITGGGLGAVWHRLSSVPAHMVRSLAGSASSLIWYGLVYGFCMLALWAGAALSEVKGQHAIARLARVVGTMVALTGIGAGLYLAGTFLLWWLSSGPAFDPDECPAGMPSRFC